MVASISCRRRACSVKVGRSGSALRRADIPPPPLAPNSLTCRFPTVSGAAGARPARSGGAGRSHLLADGGQPVRQVLGHQALGDGVRGGPEFRAARAAAVLLQLLV